MIFETIYRVCVALTTSSVSGHSQLSWCLELTPGQQWFLSCMSVHLLACIFCKNIPKGLAWLCLLSLCRMALKFFFLAIRILSSRYTTFIYQLNKETGLLSSLGLFMIMLPQTFQTCFHMCFHSTCSQGGSKRMCKCSAFGPWCFTLLCL